MERASAVMTAKPNVGSLGYALFLAINAASVWGGVFPFLPMEFQTHEIAFWFFLTQSLVFSASYAASTVGSYFFPGPTRAFLVKAVSGPYFAGWCCLIAAIYLDGWALPLITVGGAFLGLGSAGFYMLWQRLFASEDADTGNHDLLLGTAWGAVLYYALYLIPQAVTAFLIPLVFLPLFALCVTLRSREIDLDQPMFEDVPREHPQVYRRVLLDHWRSALCVGALGFCAGIMRAVAVADPQVGSLVNMLSMAGMLVAAVAMMAVWRSKNLRLSITAAYRVVFPFLITSLLALPLLSQEYARWLAAILFAVYSAAIMLMMMQCAQTSRDRGINPVFIYGYFGAIVYALHGIGFIGGTFAEEASLMGVAPLAVVALVAIWALGVMQFVGTGGFSGALGPRGEAEAIELVALGPRRDPSPTQAAPSGDATPLPSGAASPEGEPIDLIAVQAELVRERYRLSAREAEVMELIARGHSVARIAEMLVVSENTIRTHSKRIYAKLDIHKKQELVDLLATFGDAQA
ncbi:MAG: helix-turn-helix transcriptional regulator [Eggerthellaceae bacterium]|nr:helix-turn-helix transcriptional regulator [Eggerthellaceae bacterium]